MWRGRPRPRLFRLFVSACPFRRGDRGIASARLQALRFDCEHWTAPIITPDVPLTVARRFSAENTKTDSRPLGTPEFLKLSQR